MTPQGQEWSFRDWLDDPTIGFLWTIFKKYMLPLILVGLSFHIFVIVLRLGPILWVLILTLGIYVYQEFRWAMDDINHSV